MKIRIVDVDNEKMHNCVFCDTVSTSLTCETMFEIEDETTGNKIYICEDCLNAIQDEFLRMSRQIKHDME